MKPHVRLLLAFCLASFVMSASAQIGNVVVFAPKGEKFSLFVGNTLHNSQPAARVEADNPGGPSFKLKVVFADASVHDISKLVFNKPHSTMFFKVEKNAKGVFTMESTSSEWTDGANAGGQDKTVTSSSSATPPSKETGAEQPVKSETTTSSKEKGCDHPISDADFTAQLIDISARPFEPMQLSAAKKMAETHCLLVSQVILVIHVFDMESSRLSFAKYAYDFTSDRSNYSDVKDALHSDKSKADLDKFLAGKQK